MSRVQFTSHPLISWHRGGQELQPHASREAFLTAIERGAELIEIDVRATHDGLLVCWHDEHLPSGVAVRDATRDDIGDLMTWREFVLALSERDPTRRSGIHLDLKDVGYELAAVDPLLESGRPFFVTTLEKSSVRLLRRARPEADAFLTVGRDRGNRSRWSRWWLRASEIFPYWNVMSTNATGVALHHSLLRPRLARWMHRRQLRIVVWTVNGRDSMHRLLADPAVDALTTNFPLKALAVRDEVVSTRMSA
jgi:glycerophosphoryl diester phosphodiesterase